MWRCTACVYSTGAEEACCACVKHKSIVEQVELFEPGEQRNAIGAQKSRQRLEPWKREFAVKKVDRRQAANKQLAQVELEPSGRRRSARLQKTIERSALVLH